MPSTDETTETWVLGPGKTLAERILPRPQPIRVATQWCAWGVLLSAALTGSAWLSTVSLLVFLLLWYGSYRKRQDTRRVIDSLPLLRAGRKDEPDAGPLPSVTIIAPARNEEAGIEGAARSLANLNYPGLNVLIVDDHSTDDTPRILDRLAEQHSAIRVLHDPPPQAGWLGKANAVWYAVAETDPDPVDGAVPAP